MLLTERCEITKYSKTMYGISFQTWTLQAPISECSDIRIKETSGNALPLTSITFWFAIYKHPPLIK
jgi:hypothetical protein